MIAVLPTKRSCLRLIFTPILLFASVIWAKGEETRTLASISERVFTPVPQQPETGEIRGSVVDAEDGQPIIGAYVVFEDTRTGTTTNINGEFRFENKEVGDYSIVFSFVGYATVRRKVTVTKGQITSFTVRLPVSTSTLDDVVVYGTVDKTARTPATSTEISLVDNMKYSETIVTGISREQIVKSLDRSGSDIVRRISSVSLLDRFVVVRGMDPRYNITLLNGIVAPSSEESTRAFSYDAIPAGAIDNINLSKAPLAELPAMWGGGVLELSTRSTSVAREISLGVSSQYRSGGSSLTNRFLTYDVPRSANNDDWLAAGADDRRMPTILRKRFFNYPDAQQYPLENAAIAREGDFRTFTPRERSQGLDARGNFSYYDSWLIGKILRLNNLTAVSYTNESQLRLLQQARGRSVYKPKPTGGSQVLPGDITYNETLYQQDSGAIDARIRDSLYEEQIRVSVIQGLGLVWGQNHRLDATVFYNRFGTDQVINRDEDTQDAGRVRRFSYRYSQRSIGMAQLSGQHKVGTNELRWTVGGATTRDDVPDLQYYSFTRDGRNSEELYNFPGGARTIETILENGRYVYETSERSVTGRLDYVKSPEGWLGLKLKAGVFYDRKNRDFFAQNHSILNSPEGLSPDPWNHIDTLYTPEKFGPDGLILVTAANQRAYSFDDETRAAYGSVNLPFWNRRLNLYAGLRVSNLRRTLYDELKVPVSDLATFQGVTSLIPDQYNTYVLPSASLRYALPDSSILRVAYGETIDRPQFREQSSLRYVNVEQRRNYGGNPFLENAYLRHFDVRYDRYPRPGEVLTLGGFYKRIDRPILLTEGDGAEGLFDEIGPTNGNYATVWGAELEVRKRLDFDFIPTPLRRLSVILNVTLMRTRAVLQADSIQDFSGSGDSLVTTTVVVPGRTTRLQGASPVLLNVGLYYDDVQRGTNVSLIYNYTGDRLQIYNQATELFGDILEGRRHDLDIVFSQQLGDYITLKGGVQNVLDNTIFFYRDVNNNYTLDQPEASIVPRSTGNQLITDLELSRFKPGRYFSLGITLSVQ